MYSLPNNTNASVGPINGTLPYQSFHAYISGLLGGFSDLDAETDAVINKNTPVIRIGGWWSLRDTRGSTIFWVEEIMMKFRQASI